MAKHIITDEERKARACARAKAWREAHPDESRAYQVHRRATKRAQLTAYDAKWRAANLEKSRAIKKAYRDRHRKPRVVVTLEERAEKDRRLRRASSLRNRVKRIAQRKDWYRRNRENVLEKQRNMSADDRVKSRATARRWKAANPDANKAITEAWRAANIERIRAYQRARYAQNPIPAAAANAKRRARKRAAGGSFTKADVSRLMAAQRGRCAYCATSIKKQYHIDHINPLVRGGHNGPRNLQLLCVTCNLRKGPADPVQFAQRIGLLL